MCFPERPVAIAGILLTVSSRLEITTISEHIHMPRLLSHSRFLILIPILGLVLAAAFFFVFGGMGLILMIGHLVCYAVAHAPERDLPA